MKNRIFIFLQCTEGGGDTPLLESITKEQAYKYPNLGNVMVQITVWGGVDTNGTTSIVHTKFNIS
jgi:hypothetical protein